MNLILLDGSECCDGRIRMTGRRAVHAISVLRVAPGRQVRVGLIDGPMGVATVTRVESESVEMECRFAEAAPAPARIHLLLAMPRPKVLKRLWAALAAMGVGRVWIVNAARVERNYFDTHVLEPGFIRERLCEGLEQAVDTRVPVVSIHRRLKAAVEDELDAAFPAPCIRLAAEPGAAPSIHRALGPADPKAQVLLAVGPEGGWVEYERGLLRAHGFQPVSLGPRILRSDTACLVALGLVQESLRDAPPHPPAGALSRG